MKRSSSIFLTIPIHVRSILIVIRSYHPEVEMKSHCLLIDMPPDDLPVRVVKLVTEVVQNELEAAATEHLTEPRDTCVHIHVAADLAMPPRLQSVQVIINH